MRRWKVLVVDDEPGMIEVCCDSLARIAEAEVEAESSASKAAERIRASCPDLLIVDIRMPGLSGIDLLRIAREQDAGVHALVITAFPSVETAVESMKLGAADYMTKPIRPEDLVAAVRRILACRGLIQENALLARQVERPHAFDEIVGGSPAMLKVFDTIQRVAETDVDVLIHGETGSGKELVARSIHRRSRRSGRFVPVDCSAIPEELLESELFGHERGAFTGAHARSIGLIEFADRGTFFMDEVGDMPQRLQAKLLRALQERRIRRVGGAEEIPIELRVLAATARDLEQDIGDRRFREDLYYRINVVRIELPPLRERREDIPLLVDHFVRRYGGEMQKGEVAVDEDAVEVLQRYSWPGNVRELQNVLKRALAMTRHQILTVTDLPDELVLRAGEPGDHSSAGFFIERSRVVSRFERDYLEKLMLTHAGDASAAARSAGLPLGTLYRLLKKHDLRPGSFRSAES